MVDTLNISLHNCDPQVNNLEITGQGWRWASGKQYKIYYTEYTANNLKIRLYNDKVLRTYGSIAKFLTMSNINTLDRHQTKDAISMLENLISAELKEAVVRRLDFAATLNVTQQVNSYYPFLGNRAYLPRIQTTEDTLEYRNSNRGIIFYDKGKEEKIFNENLMRVECRWMKATLVRLLSKGERGIVTVADILDKNNFSFFIKQWQNEYIEIEKIRKLVFDLTNVQPKDVISILALAGIGSFGGLDKFLEIISASLGISEKHNKFLPRVRDMLYDRYNNDKFTTKQSTIHELDELMEVHAKQCLEINK